VRSRLGRRFLSAAAIVLAAVLSQCRSAPQGAAVAPLRRGDWEALRRRLSEIIQTEIEANKIVGLSVALVNGEQTVFSRGFGHADRDAGELATEETLYRIGSVSKLLVATAVMQLAEQGLVSIDQPYSEKVPAFEVKTRFPQAPPITPRMLLTHHAGLPDIVRDAATDPSTGLLVVPDLSEEYLALPPGIHFSYSNLGFRLLGCLVESVSGARFSDYIDEHVLRPLGMSRTSFWSPGVGTAGVSVGYAEGKAIVPPPMYDPAGSIWTSVSDLARFMKMVLAGGVLDGARVIGEATLAEMLSAQNEGVPLDLDQRVGLGWHLYDLKGLLPDGTVAAGHTGYDTIFTSFLLVLPELGLGVVVLCNTDEGGNAVMNIGYRAMQLLHEARTGVRVEPLPMPEEDVTAIVRPAPTDLETLTGFYETNGSDPFIEVKLRGGRLVSRIEGESVQIVPLAGGRFTVRYLLFGFLPVRMRELERSTFSFRSIVGHEVIIEHRGPFRRLAGTKLVRVPIPPAWKARLGTWDCVDPGDEQVYVRSLTLSERSGFLLLDATTYAKARDSGMPWGAVLEPLSDTEAIAPGIQHSRSGGQTLLATQDGGGELLAFAGYRFRRVPGSAAPRP
jgi:CubicO group peptidase (beta-lactamase class C family)